ncbi:MAG: hypothetical protein AABY27_04215 [Pseudomonadota bacterium]
MKDGNSAEQQESILRNIEAISKEPGKTEELQNQFSELDKLKPISNNNMEQLSKITNDLENKNKEQNLSNVKNNLQSQSNTSNSQVSIPNVKEKSINNQL